MGEPLSCVNKPQFVQSVLTASVKILPYRPPARELIISVVLPYILCHLHLYYFEAYRALLFFFALSMIKVDEHFQVLHVSGC